MEVPAFLSLATLFAYLDATPNSRSINEGQAVLNAKHIITCGITSKKGNEIELLALSLQTSAIAQRPHEIKGILSVTGATVKILKFLCTCKAVNSGQCKHVAAVLLLCSRENIQELTQLSSTDLKCYWSSRTGEEQYMPAPLLEQDCLKKKMSPKKNAMSEEECAAALEIYASHLPTSSYGLHRSGRRQSVEETEAEELPSSLSVQLHEVVKCCAYPNLLDTLQAPVFAYDCCEEFYNSLKNVDVAKVAAVTKGNKELWHKERQFRITGSRCYSIFTYGLNDWKTKSTKYFWPKSFKSKYTSYGIEHEAAARKAYSQRTGCRVFETGVVVSQKQPWLAYSPDGIIFEDGKPSGLLEIKYPYSGKDSPAVNLLTTCTYLKSPTGEEVQLKKKHMYYAQIQLGMAILNLKKCDFILYSAFDKNYCVIHVKYDIEYTKVLLEKLNFNYFNYMLHHRCTE